MGKHKKRPAEVPPSASTPASPAAPAADHAAPHAFECLWLLLWAATFCALAGVADLKILRYKLLAVEAGVALLWAGVILRWAADKSAVWLRTPLDLPVALYGAGGVLFYLLSPERGASSLELTRMLFCAAAFFAAAQTLGAMRRPERALWAWAGTAALVAVGALLQLRGGLGRLAVPQLDRPMVTFGNPIFLGAYLAASAAAAAGLAWSVLGRASKLPSYALAACCALCLAGLWTTQSRASVAGIALACALAALIALDGRRRKSAALALFAGVLLAAWHFRDRQWTHGLIWRDTLELWRHYPWFGCGLGRFHIEFREHASEALKALWPQRQVIVNFAHNEYLQVLAETGVAGLGLLALVLGSAGLWLLRDWRALAPSEEKRWSLGLGLAGAALAGQNFFSPDLRFGLSSFVLFFCLGAALSRSAGRPAAFPVFPGRLGCAALAGMLLLAWGRGAVEPLLAQRRLAREPGFHVERSDELSELLRRGEEQLAKDPANADIAENLAYVYAKERSWPQAIARFELAARLDPKRPGPLNNLGNIHYLLQDREKAIVYWKRSIGVKPDQIDAHTNLGKALYEVGRLKESSSHLQEVLKLDPDNEKAQILLKKMIE